jgi:hypothetical protein
MRNQTLNLKIEIEKEDSEWLKHYCQSLGMRYQWFLGNVLKDEIRRLKIAEGEKK